jgi:hypothetical protein
MRWFNVYLYLPVANGLYSPVPQKNIYEIRSEWVIVA